MHQSVLLETPVPPPSAPAPEGIRLEDNPTVLRLEVTTLGHFPAPLKLYLAYAQVGGVWRGIHSEPTEGWQFIEPLYGPAWGGQFIRRAVRVPGVKGQGKVGPQSALPYLRLWRDAFKFALDSSALVARLGRTPLGHAALPRTAPRSMRDQTASFEKRFLAWQDTPHSLRFDLSCQSAVQAFFELREWHSGKSRDPIITHTSLTEDAR